MRPMPGFAEQSNLALAFCNAGLHRRKCSSPSSATLALPIAKTHPAARARSMQHCYSLAASRQTLPGCVFSAEYFPLLHGNGRFRGDGSATRLPPKGPVLSHAIQLCHGFAACRPQDCEISRIEVKWLNAGADRSVARKLAG
jgi:hypothetical protein